MKETLDVILMTTQNYVNVNDEYLFWLFSWYLLNDLVRKETCLHCALYSYKRPWMKETQMNKIWNVK